MSGTSLPAEPVTPGTVEPETTLPAESTTLRVTRNNLGRFVKGRSPNPAGRAKGSRNRSTMVKAFIEEALTNGLAKKAMKILDNAVNLALHAEDEKVRASMSKFLIGDMLENVRVISDDANIAADKRLPQAVQINITHVYGDQTPSPAPSDAIEADFTDVGDPHG